VGVVGATANGISPITGFVFGTTLFLVTGTLTTSFFSSPVVSSFVVTTLSSFSTTGTTS